MTASALRVQRLARFELESGEVLADVEQAYRLEGRLSAAKDNLVVVFHSLTGSPADFGGWWGTAIGPGKPVDTARCAVLAPNLLGSCYGTRWRRGSLDPPGAPSITTRDMARLVGALVEELGVSSVALATGGSLGGMVALEWAATFPAATRAVVAFAAPAAGTAAAIGWNHVQREALRVGGAEGLALARMVGMLTYRTPEELAARFGRARTRERPFDVQAYLDGHGKKLVDRFDAASYATLLDAMDSHDVGRGRGGVARALARFSGALVGVGIPEDRLYECEVVRAWCAAAGASFRSLRSLHGHDGFLLETAGAARVLGEALGWSEARRPTLPGASRFAKASRHAEEPPCADRDLRLSPASL